MIDLFYNIWNIKVDVDRWLVNIEFFEKKKEKG